MTLWLHRILCVLVALGLAVSAAAAGQMRTAHAIASVGQTEIVICGESGAQAVTLDREGNVVERNGAECGHCADCMLVLVADPSVQITPILPRVRPDSATTMTRRYHPANRAIFNPARAPPTRGII